MKRLSGYTGISLLAHFLFILALVDVSFSPRDDLSAFDVYEVDIVTSVPSAGRPPFPVERRHPLSPRPENMSITKGASRAASAASGRNRGRKRKRRSSPPRIWSPWR
ncbi:MAG: hypothetical protein ACOX3E_04250 [Desulfomonilia bacterium]